ncbi:hypothetical protein [Kitasatospora sp. NPDC002040]|uniref:hypothetical protein n=1 Tax=Kitasatospora sp. NPDC002040 TaxID=3154661 RepID=UPI00332A9C05
MTDNTLWVGVLTAGTAVVASWVTSRGTARAARIQAETTAAVQRADQRHTMRRSAFADVIEQAQKMGDLYWKVNDAHADPDPESRAAALKDLRLRLRDAYATLRHLVRVVELEGPQEAAAAADRLRRSTSASYQALEDDRGRRGRDPAVQRVLRPVLGAGGRVPGRRAGGAPGRCRHGAGPGPHLVVPGAPTGGGELNGGRELNGLVPPGRRPRTDRRHN